MARGLNKVLLIGRLGQDPEIKTTDGGLTIAQLSVATSHSVKNKETGQWEDATEWHRVVLFNKPAEIAAQYLQKGSQVYIEGRLQTRKWQDQNGQDRYTIEIIANELQMLGGGNSDNQQQPTQKTNQQQRGGNQQNYGNQQRGNQRQQQGMTPPSARDLDEEIPF